MCLPNLASIYRRQPVPEKEEKLEETLWSVVVQSKQLRALHETFLKEDVLPTGIDRDIVRRRVDQLWRQENDIRTVVTDTPLSPLPSTGRAGQRPYA